MRCPLGKDELFIEDSDIISKIQQGTKGIFMPTSLGSQEVSPEDGVRLVPSDLAEYGFQDGLRYAFLETKQGLLYDQSAYPSIAGREDARRCGVIRKTHGQIGLASRKGCRHRAICDSRLACRTQKAARFIPAPVMGFSTDRAVFICKAAIAAGKHGLRLPKSNQYLMNLEPGTPQIGAFFGNCLFYVAAHRAEVIGYFFPAVDAVERLLIQPRMHLFRLHRIGEAHDGGLIAFRFGVL